MKMKKEHISVIHGAYEKYLDENKEMKEIIEDVVSNRKYKSHISLCWEFFKGVKIEGNSSTWLSDNCSYLNDSHITTVLVREFKSFFPKLVFTTNKG